MCAARFKQFDQAGLLQQTRRTRYGEVDSPGHLLQRTGAGQALVEQTADEAKAFLRKLIQEAAKLEPFIPPPYKPEIVEEISLDGLAAGSDKGICSSLPYNQLSFEGVASDAKKNNTSHFWIRIRT